MSQQLGQSYTPPIGTEGSISIPTTDAPQKQLQTDVKQQIISSSSVTGDTFKLLASSSDGTPGYLSAKITAGEFSIVLNKLKLVGFGDLTTDDLSQGTTNLFYTDDAFDTKFAAKDTDDLNVGVTNKYYLTSLFDTDFATKTTDNLTEGSTNLYLTTAINSAITTNTINSHTHTNKSYLDAIARSGANINTAVDNSHTHSNETILDAITEPFTTDLKTTYDNYASNSINSATSPLDITLGVLTHSDEDGYKHVPSNSGVDQYSVLASGASTGSYTWTDIDTIIANSSIFESTPSTSTILGVQSNYINSLVTNTITDKNLLTDAQLTYVSTTIPSHIANTLLHLPTIVVTTDRGKFLHINTSDEPEWTNSTASITTTGDGTYITASGTVITVDLIDITDTNITAGSNITISGNEISSTQRAISGTPTSGATTTSISSNWAYTHNNDTGVGSHIPSSGTSEQYLNGLGAWADFSAAPGGTYKIVMGSGSTGSVTERIAHEDTEFPSGWSGAVGTTTTDLVITHDTGTAPTNTTIWVDDGTDKTLLIGSAGYSTIIGNSTDTEITIVSLTTITENINIYIQFE